MYEYKVKWGSKIGGTIWIVFKTIRQGGNS